MKEITNVVFAGVGGQGLQVRSNELHGMAQRGGSVLSHVRFGPEVHSPLVEPKTLPRSEGKTKRVVDKRQLK